MYAAAAFGARAAAAVLIRAGADISSDGNFGHVPTPAYIAAVQGHVGILEELHSAGTPEALQTFHTAVEHTGATPLYGAAASGHASTVRFLLEQTNAPGVPSGELSEMSPSPQRIETASLSSVSLTH